MQRDNSETASGARERMIKNRRKNNQNHQKSLPNECLNLVETVQGLYGRTDYRGTKGGRPAKG